MLHKKTCHFANIMEDPKTTVFICECGKMQKCEYQQIPRQKLLCEMCSGIEEAILNYRRMERNLQTTLNNLFK